MNQSDSKALNDLMGLAKKNVTELYSDFKKRSSNPNISNRTLLLMACFEHFANQFLDDPVYSWQPRLPYNSVIKSAIEDILNNGYDALGYLTSEFTMFASNVLSDESKSKLDTIDIYWKKPTESYSMLLTTLHESLKKERPFLMSLMRLHHLSFSLHQDNDDMFLINDVEQLIKLLSRADVIELGSDKAEKILAEIEACVAEVDWSISGIDDDIQNTIDVGIEKYRRSHLRAHAEKERARKNPVIVFKEEPKEDSLHH